MKHSESAGSRLPASHAARGRRIKVAVLGAGTVGGETVRLLQAYDHLELVGVLVNDVSRPRPFHGWRELVTTDRTVADAADIVVETIGGTTLASELALDALGRGAAVVSANKASLAEHWDDYLPALREGRVHFEAAVMAGTPVVGALSNALRGCAPVALQAVLNGTCNVILSAMESGAKYADALADAQAAGFAEADPTLDVEGIDAAHKLTILGRLAFDPALVLDDVLAATTGISGVTAREVAEQGRAGRSIRLLGSVVPHAHGGGWKVTVEPFSLPRTHALVGPGAGNAMSFTGDPLGEVLLRGPGAGAGATASAVVADVLTAAAGRPGPVPLDHAADPGRAARFLAEAAAGSAALADVVPLSEAPAE